MSKLGEIINKRRTVSIWDITSFVVQFTFAYSVFFISLYITKLFDKQPTESFTTRQWLVIIIGSFVLVAFTYFRELFATRKKEMKLKERKIIYDCIGGAIEQLIEFKENEDSEKPHYINELLKYVEKVVNLVLREYGISRGEICANLMIKKEEPLELELIYFGTFLSGRTKISLPIEINDLLPGAPEAYHYKKTMYVNDTMSEKFKKYFDESKPYRSIISTPILNGEDTVIAVINIDSDQANQFVSKDFIDKKILPSINPLVLLVKLEKNLIINEQNSPC